MSYVPAGALIIAVYLLPCQAFLGLSTQYGEPLLAGWLFCFTGLDTNLFLLVSLCCLVWAFYGLTLVPSVLLLVLAFDASGPLSFSLGGLTQSEQPTSALFNGALFLHPPLLYCSLAYAIIVAYWASYYKRETLRPRLRYHQLTTRGFTSTLIALFLGALWAQQELNWGGWWSWDLVEVGSLVVLIFNVAHLHVKDWAYQTPGLAPVTFFFFSFFFLGLRYGLFDSIHSFISLSQIDFLACIAYYFLGFVGFVGSFKYKYRHTLLGWFSVCLALVGFAFLGDFFHKYYGCPWSWPLNKHLMFTLISCFTLLSRANKAKFNGALTPYFLTSLELKTFRAFSGRQTHTIFFSLILGLAVTKGVVYSKESAALPLETIWLVHTTYLGQALELWEIFSTSETTCATVGTGCKSIYWGYLTHHEQLNNHFISWTTNWLHNLVGQSLLVDLAKLSFTLDFAFFLYLCLLKKSRV